MKNPSRHAELAADSPATYESELQHSLVEAIYEASPEGILVVDADNRVASHNTRFVEIWRIPRDRLHGAKRGTAIGGDDSPILSTVLERVKHAPSFLARVQELYANPDLDDHCEIELLDGRTIERRSTVLRTRSRVYLGRVWFFLDISLRKDLENKLRTLSYKDSLTGVTNRRYFFELASLEIARSRRSHDPLSVVEFDIDHFKQINDTHGHAVGDEVLNAVCARCQQLLRKTDVLARMGGEEFVVLLPDASLEEATQLAERLRQAIADSAMSPVAGYPGCTVSIGVTLLDAADTSIEDCLLRADRAMYQAKQDGRNRVKIEP